MRILLAIDGSRSADVARDLVAAMPWPAGSAIRIVSVVPGNASLGIDLSPDTANRAEVDRYRDPSVRAHAIALAEAERELNMAHLDVRVERFLLRGRAASLILQEARDFAADLIVVGHRGHGTIETMLLGSVSAEVVDHAPCAVLVARAAERGRIVFADDGSLSARVAASVLEGLPLPPTTPISVLTIDDETYPYDAAVSPALYNGAMAMHQESRDQARQQALAVASAAAARFQQLGYRATPVVRSGDPAQELVAYAREERTGLLVLGTRGHTGLRRLLLGSVARNVLIHAPCSVLIVRETVVPPTNAEALIEQMAGKGG
jgi:nucleotide-binding universal stress UspA family protein